MSRKDDIRTQKATFFWRWWDEAEHKSSPEKRLAFYDAIMRYIFSGETPPDPLEMDNPTGADYAAYDATHYFDVIDSFVEHPLGGAPKGNQNARKKTTENNLAKQPETTSQNNREGLNDEVEETTETTDAKQPFKRMKNEERRMKNIYPPHKPPVTGGSAGADMFERFWDAWPKECPRKTDKTKCRKKFDAILKREGSGAFDAIMDGLAWWKGCDLWTKDGGQFVCAPLVWLNGERWMDRPLKASATARAADATAAVLAAGDAEARRVADEMRRLGVIP